MNREQRRANGQRGPAEPPQQQQLQIRVIERITYPEAMVGVIDAGNGSREIHFFTVDGKERILPLDPDSAKQVGEKLLSPSIAVANAGDMPQ